MTTEDEGVQERLQAALQAELDLEEGAVVGWVIAYETLAEGGDAFCGHLYGPPGMTSWRALGLLDWAAQHTIKPGDE